MTPPTRPEPFDPRDADPLDVQPVDVRLVRLREQPRPRRLGCSIFALLLLVIAVLIATPRSGQTTIAAPRDLSELRADSSAALSGAPLSLTAGDRTSVGSGPRPVASGERTGRGAPHPRTEAPVPSPSGEISAISSGVASWFDAKGYQGAVPWWRAGQQPVWASVCRFADGRSRCVTVLITGFCQCLAGTDAERAIDLSRNAFEQLADPGLGLIVVQIEIPVQGPRLPATDTSSIAASGFGMHGAPRLSMTATCRSSGHQAVWVAQTGTAFLDIIQVGTMDGELFYAYGRGEPNGPDSLYVERHVGPSGTGPHRYGVALEAKVWTLTVDGRVVVTVPDTFRTWHLRATQVMAEGELPFGEAGCEVGAGVWRYGGYGPQPRTSIGAASWRVADG